MSAILKISLKSARVNANYTQNQVAKILKISERTLQKWENGETFPDAVKIAELCNLYGVHYDNINFLPNNSL